MAVNVLTRTVPRCTVNEIQNNAEVSYAISMCKRLLDLTSIETVLLAVA